MTNDEYAELAMKTAPNVEQTIPRYMNRLLLAAIGMSGEVGELVEHIKKHVFHNHPIDRAKIVKEMGDVEWYFNLLREEFDISLEEVHAANIVKLAARYPEGFFTPARSITRAVGDE